MSLLQPVSPDNLPDLSAEEARPPGSLPEEKDKLRDRLDEMTEEMDDLQRALYAEGKRALLVVLQARDAGGKDGTIRKVFGPLNPQGVRVASFRAPNERELAHDYLWRVHREVPARGMIGVFNRSHYEDVLVVRVHGLVPEPVWQQRYDQINDFERMLAANGVTILKFFLHVSPDEQLERLVKRLENPSKNWKFNPGDLGERAKWDQYTAAYRDMLARCNTPWAPWYVVPADDKPARDVMVAEVVLETLERMNPRYPEADREVIEKYSRELGVGNRE